jgi:hypothetical protein
VPVLEEAETEGPPRVEVADVETDRERVDVDEFGGSAVVEMFPEAEGMVDGAAVKLLPETEGIPGLMDTIAVEVSSVVGGDPGL